jgi:Cu2+-exporting ATPase
VGTVVYLYGGWPLAAPIGLTIAPGLAAILMSVSTVVVVLNAHLLRRLDLRLSPAPGDRPAMS